MGLGFAIAGGVMELLGEHQTKDNLMAKCMKKLDSGSRKFPITNECRNIEQGCKMKDNEVIANNIGLLLMYIFPIVGGTCIKNFYIKWFSRAILIVEVATISSLIKQHYKFDQDQEKKKEEMKPFVEAKFKNIYKPQEGEYREVAFCKPHPKGRFMPIWINRPCV